MVAPKEWAIETVGGPLNVGHYKHSRPEVAGGLQVGEPGFVDGPDDVSVIRAVVGDGVAPGIARLAVVSGSGSIPTPGPTYRLGRAMRVVPGAGTRQRPGPFGNARVGPFHVPGGGRPDRGSVHAARYGVTACTGLLESGAMDHLVAAHPNDGASRPARGHSIRLGEADALLGVFLDGSIDTSPRLG